jgi:hypothetical protein
MISASTNQTRSISFFPQLPGVFVAPTHLIQYQNLCYMYLVVVLMPPRRELVIWH